MKPSKFLSTLILLFQLLVSFTVTQAETKVTLNPPLESLPNGEFIPVVLDQSTLKLYWIAPQGKIRNGVHSLIVREVTGQKYGEIAATKDSGRFIVGGFIKTEGNIFNFHGRNSFNSTTFNEAANDNRNQGILEFPSRKKLLDYIRVQFPNATFQANTKLFDPGNHSYTQEQQAKLADVYARGWQEQVESYNDPKTIRSTSEYVALKRLALTCKKTNTR